MMNAIVRGLKRIAIGLAVTLLALYALALMYALPKTAVINITGTEVKRGIGGVGGDVRYVLAAKQDGSALVFRNEDTGWGFPPYFKFDSGTVAAEANNLAKKHPDAPVLVRYYGFRVPMFSLFPNVVSLKVVAEDFENFPLFNIIFLTVNFLVFVYLGIKVWQWRRRKRRQQPA